jgi:prevent-host-death family protein
MKTASITQVKNGLSALVDQVRAGESILVTDRGVVVARLEPAGTGPDSRGRLERLERAGLVRVGRAAPPVELIRVPAPRAEPGASVVQVLLDERRDGR